MESSKLGCQKEKTPESGSTGSGVGHREPRGSQARGEVVVIVFMTMNELRVSGPLALRPWLERSMRTLKKGPAQIVTFQTGWHQEARSSGDGGVGVK